MSCLLMEELGNLAPSPGPWYSSTWQRQHEPCLSLADESLHPTATSHVCQFQKRIRYKDLIYVCCCNLYFGGSNHCNPAAQALELQPTTCLSLCWQVFWAWVRGTAMNFRCKVWAILFYWYYKVLIPSSQEIHRAAGKSSEKGKNKYKYRMAL